MFLPLNLIYLILSNLYPLNDKFYDTDIKAGAYHCSGFLWFLLEARWFLIVLVIKITMCFIKYLSKKNNLYSAFLLSQKWCWMISFLCSASISRILVTSSCCPWPLSQLLNADWCLVDFTARIPRLNDPKPLYSCPHLWALWSSSSPSMQNKKIRSI